MAQGALVLRWGPAVRGRETRALEVFVEAAGYFDDLVKNHRLSSHHPYISADRNGGVWILNGETGQLADLREEADYLRLTTRAQMTVEDYTTETCFGGSADDLAEVMGLFAETVQDFS